jgi:hypothetical protein
MFGAVLGSSMFAHFRLASLAPVQCLSSKKASDLKCVITTSEKDLRWSRTTGTFLNGTGFIFLLFIRCSCGRY